MKLADLFDVELGGVDTARGRPVHVPKGALLCVQDLPLLLVSLPVHLGLRLGLHEDVLPLPAEHLLQARQVLGLVVGQLQPRLVLHGSLAQVHRVVGVLGSPVLRRPVVRSLETVVRAVVFDLKKKYEL